MPSMIKLPVVTRWATNYTRLQNGYYNRLYDEPTISYKELGFSTNSLPRQPLNYILYNHGENLNFAIYHLNRPIQVDTKTSLPVNSDNEGLMYYVKDVKKLVMMINGTWTVIAVATTTI